MSPKKLVSLAKEVLTEFSEDKAARLSAALAYYTIFSLAPLLIIVIAVVGFFWGNQPSGVQANLVQEIRAMLGPEGAAAIQAMLENASRPGSGGVVATVLGVVTLLVGATGVFSQLQSALNTIWDVEPLPGRGIKGIVQTRLLSFGMILGVGFLLLVSLVVTAVLSALSDYATGLAPGLELLFQVLNFVVSFAIVTLLFAMIYRVLPDVEIAWHDVWLGAAITALLFTVGKLAIGLYLGNSSVGSTFGAAGSLVVLLVWIYYSALILFLGAEITQVAARHYGSRIAPSRHARHVPATPAEVEEIVEERVEERLQRQPARSAPARRGGSPLARLAPLAAAFFVGRWLGRR